jgi:hypothetical protein
MLKLKIEDWELDTGQIVDDLAPISRLEGNIFLRKRLFLNGFPLPRE